MSRSIPFGAPWMGEAEEQAVADVLRSGWLAHGPKVKEFEQAFAAHLGVKHAVSVSSCTAALHLSLLALGIGPGDEVIVPAQTHVATAHAVMYVGAKPVFADIERGTGNISPASIFRGLTPRTKAIIVVHFAGLPCEMDEISKIAENKSWSSSKTAPMPSERDIGAGRRERWAPPAAFPSIPSNTSPPGKAGC